MCIPVIYHPDPPCQKVTITLCQVVRIALLYRFFSSRTLNCLARFPEFFLHHEGFNWQRATSRTPSTYLTEQYHSTPEAHSDEPYNHPEDIEHFAHHKPIEREEARRETKYQDITAKEALV